jgi:hypothetical protein
MPLEQANPMTGDPNLGPNDVRVEIQLRLIGQKEVLAQTAGSVPLFNALTDTARGAVACAIETGFEWAAQSAVRKLNDLILQRSEAKGTGKNDPERWPETQPVDFPECLPKPPPRKAPPTSQ